MLAAWAWPAACRPAGPRSAVAGAGASSTSRRPCSRGRQSRRGGPARPAARPDGAQAVTEAVPPSGPAGAAGSGAAAGVVPLARPPCRRRPAGTEPGGQQQRIRPQADEQQQRGQRQARPRRTRRVRPGPAGPRASPTRAPGRIRLGPATAPTVTAHTTIARDRPRCSGSARSTAAKRACRLAAVPRPSRAAASSSTGKLPVTVDTITSRASGHGGEQARDQGGPPAAPVRPVRRGAGRPPRPEGHDRGDRSGPGVGAGELDGQQGADGQAGAAADAAEELRGAQHPNGTALDPLRDPAPYRSLPLCQRFSRSELSRTVRATRRRSGSCGSPLRAGRPASPAWPWS